MGYSLLNSVMEDAFFSPFTGLLSSEERPAKRYAMMKTDIVEKDDAYVLYIDMPGFDKKDISVSYKDEYLTVSAKEGEADKGVKFLRRERVQGYWSRSYYVGDIKEDAINASYKDGVLEVSIPKEVVEKKQHFVEIR